MVDWSNFKEDANFIERENDVTEVHFFLKDPHQLKYILDDLGYQGDVERRSFTAIINKQTVTVYPTGRLMVQDTGFRIFATAFQWATTDMRCMVYDAKYSKVSVGVLDTLDGCKLKVNCGDIRYGTTIASHRYLDNFTRFIRARRRKEIRG